MNNGGPAQDMSKLEHFAVVALRELLQRSDIEAMQFVVRDAWAIADAMLAESEKRK